MSLQAFALCSSSSDDKELTRLYRAVAALTRWADEVIVNGEVISVFQNKIFVYDNH